MNLYTIVGWNDTYENNRTRELKHMAWVPVPNKHDGDGYTLLVDRPNGAAMLGAWLAILQVASKCEPRGTLLREGAIPHDAASIARITRIPRAIIEEAIPILANECKWLEIKEVATAAPSCGIPAPSCGTVTMERNGTERNGREVCVSAHAPQPEPEKHFPEVAIPSEKEVMDFAAMSGIKPDSAKAFFDHHEGNALWVNQHGRAINWQRKLASWAARDRENTSKASPAPNGARRGPFLSELRTQLEVKRELRRKIENRGHNDPTGGLVVQPKDREEFKRLNKDIAALMHQIDQYGKEGQRATVQ